jgi:hypothetical protein
LTTRCASVGLLAQSQNGAHHAKRVADGRRRAQIEEIEAELAAPSELREKPSGTATISIAQASANSLQPLRC